MKKVLAGFAAMSILFVSFPAFACGGDKQAKGDHGEPMMTTMADDENTETEADSKKKASDAKKEEKTEDTEGEV